MRIRSIKPDFFIDEDLQDLEMANPGKYVMLVFAGLWGNCDKQGVFEWRPRSLKLHILPFLDFDMADTLGVLMEAGFIERFEVNGKEYGFVPTFGKHQRITGKERDEAAKYPAPPTGKQPGIDKEKPGEQPGKQRGNNGETPETTGREGKGREKEGKPADNQRQSELTGDEPVNDPERSGRAGMTQTERALREYVQGSREFLRGKFPDADIDLELEEMVLKYRHEAIGTDPGLIAIRWFRKLPPNDRASPAGGAVVSLADQVRESNKQACRDFAGGS